MREPLQNHILACPVLVEVGDGDALRAEEFSHLADGSKDEITTKLECVRALWYTTSKHSG